VQGTGLAADDGRLTSSAEDVRRVTFNMPGAGAEVGAEAEGLLGGAAPRPAPKHFCVRCKAQHANCVFLPVFVVVSISKLVRS